MNKMKKVLSLAVILLICLIGLQASAASDGGLVAVKTDDGVYLSWQMEESGKSYNIYRDGVLLVSTDKTNYLDTSAVTASTYNLEGKEAVTVWEKGYLEIPLNVPVPTTEGVTYSPNDAAIDDLDGDGEYEIVLKWDPSDSKDAATGGKSDLVYIDAYELDGTFLWRINMGKNIRAGAHDTQMVLYDLDGDGKAELTLRTCDGTIDGTGKVIGDINAVYSDNWSGKNLTGPMFVSVFEGATGREITHCDFDPQNTPDSATTYSFGDDSGNRSERYNACVAYLDGKTPHIVFQRGYYNPRKLGPGRTVVSTFTFDGEKLTKAWRFDTMDEGNSQYIGNGNHNLSVGDVDNDGCDELFFGALALDNDGSVLWCSFKGHGDAQHLGDFDPDNEGLEFFTVHEHAPYGYTIHDAKTGDIIYDIPAGKDTGRGLILNPGPFRGSYIVNTGSGAKRLNSLGEETLLPNGGQNFRIYWNGDLYDDMLSGTAITAYNEKGEIVTLLETWDEGCASNNSSKSTPCLSGDFLGDWREEVIWRTQDNTAIRIYTTTIPTEFSIPPLMTDHIYRMGIVWQNSSYNQPPHLGYYLESGINLKIGEAVADLNGVKIPLDSAAFISQSRTMVPIRFIAEAFDADVSFSDSVVSITKPGYDIKMKIGEDFFTLNGVKKQMDAPSVITNSRTMVPIRAISEALDMNVSWDGATNSVIITRKEAKRDKVKIFIAGDSTAQSYRENMAPQAGWGQLISKFFDSSVTIENRAMAGRSLKSFFNEGRWAGILNDAEPGDYVIIQFGHNEGASNKPERYISHDDFAKMLEEEYILPALDKKLNVIIATQTQSRWFNEETGTIWEPGDGVSYASLLRDAAEKHNLPLIDINASSRALANSYGMDGSVKLYLHAAGGEYPKYPDGVADNTHFSFHGAFKIAELMKDGLYQIPDLYYRANDGYRQILTFSGSATVDVRPWGVDECKIVILGDTNVKINGQTHLTWDMDNTITTRAKAVDGHISFYADNEVTVEVLPIFKYSEAGGINTAQEEYTINLPDGTYDFLFTKNDKNRGHIWINGNIVGSNVDMYGTVNIPDNTVYPFNDFEIKGNAKIKVTEKTTSLKSIEVSPSPSVIQRKTKVFVGGDSTLCNYYPLLPDSTDADILGGTIRTGWGQVLDNYLSDEYEVVNLAASGDWARNWRDNIFPTVLQNGKEGDVFVLQFGINDRNRDDKTKETMKEALTDMVNRAEKKGIKVILVKPQPSVGYSWGNAGDFELPNGNNGGFFNVPEEVANETGCAFVNLNLLAGEHFAQVGREFVSQNYQLWDYNTNQMSDKLHISYKGANKLAEIFAANSSLNTASPKSITSIVSGIYLFENETSCEIRNSTSEYKSVYLGGTTVTIAPFCSISKPEVLTKHE